EHARNEESAYPHPSGNATQARRRHRGSARYGCHAAVDTPQRHPRLHQRRSRPPRESARNAHKGSRWLHQAPPPRSTGRRQAHRRTASGAERMTGDNVTNAASNYPTRIEEAPTQAKLFDFEVVRPYVEIDEAN